MNGTHQSHAQGLVAVDLAGTHHHIKRMITTNAAGQTHRSAPGRHGTQIHLGETNLTAGIGSDTEVAGQGQFQPAAQAVAEHGRNRRLVQRFDARQHAEALVEHCVPTAARRNLAHRLLEVHANGEIGLAFSSEKQRTHA